MVSHDGSVLGADELKEMILPSPLKHSTLSDVTEEDMTSILGKRQPLEEVKIDQDGITRLPGDKGGYKKPPKSKRTSCSSVFLTNGMVEKIRARDAKRAEKAAEKASAVIASPLEARLAKLEAEFAYEVEAKDHLLHI